MNSGMNPFETVFHLASRQAVPFYGKACPSNGNWYWSSELSCCLSSSPGIDVPSSDFMPCPGQYTWDTTASCCTLMARSTKRSSDCSGTDFWFSETGTCLPPRGGVSAAPSLSSVQCPSRWYWSAQLACCAPGNPAALLFSPSCASGLIWSPSSLTCLQSSLRSQPLQSRTPSHRPSPSPSARHHPDTTLAKTLSNRVLSACVQLELTHVLSQGPVIQATTSALIASTTCSTVGVARWTVRDKIARPSKECGTLHVHKHAVLVRMFNGVVL
ncbi:hypothetical protein BS17DRAFT_14352 [Gyrodon lividus]|nr:hypothetical protein BS17DRAFT_14352 [Gyrodon lividus]